MSKRKAPWSYGDIGEVTMVFAGGGQPMKHTTVTALAIQHYGLKSLFGATPPKSPQNTMRVYLDPHQKGDPARFKKVGAGIYELVDPVASKARADALMPLIQRFNSGESIESIMGLAPEAPVVTETPVTPTATEPVETKVETEPVETEVKTEVETEVKAEPVEVETATDASGPVESVETANETETETKEQVNVSTDTTDTDQVPEATETETQSASGTDEEAVTAESNEDSTESDESEISNEADESDESDADDEDSTDESDESEESSESVASTDEVDPDTDMEGLGEITDTPTAVIKAECDRINEMVKLGKATGADAHVARNRIVLTWTDTESGQAVSEKVPGIVTTVFSPETLESIIRSIKALMNAGDGSDGAGPSGGPSGGNESTETETSESEVESAESSETEETVSAESALDEFGKLVDEADRAATEEATDANDEEVTTENEETASGESQEAESGNEGQDTPDAEISTTGNPDGTVTTSTENEPVQTSEAKTELSELSELDMVMKKVKAFADVKFPPVAGSDGQDGANVVVSAEDIIAIRQSGKSFNEIDLRAVMEFKGMELPKGVPLEKKAQVMQTLDTSICQITYLGDLGMQTIRATTHPAHVKALGGEPASTLPEVVAVINLNPDGTNETASGTGTGEWASVGMADIMKFSVESDLDGHGNPISKVEF